MPPPSLLDVIPTLRVHRGSRPRPPEAQKLVPIIEPCSVIWGGSLWSVMAPCEVWGRTTSIGQNSSPTQPMGNSLKTSRGRKTNSNPRKNEGLKTERNVSISNKASVENINNPRSRLGCFFDPRTWGQNTENRQRSSDVVMLLFWSSKENLPVNP